MNIIVSALPQRAAQALLASQAQGLDWGWLTAQLDVHASLQGLVAAHSDHPTIRAITQRWSDRKACDEAVAVVERSLAQGLELIDWDSTHYPVALRRIFRPPLLLFVRRVVGAELPWQHPAIAIVGSRRADSSGMQIAHKFAKDMASRHVPVVSGLAVGIDAAAHEGALNSGCNSATVAVFGHGHAHCYPKQHERLVDRILDQGGATISEYTPAQAPLPFQFIARNRIIAGISHAVLVVQATRKSGSLATARFALDQGKEVLVVPGAIDDPRYEGSNRLLQEGAGLVLSSTDLLEHFPSAKQLDLVAAPSKNAAISPQAAQLMAILKDEGAVSHQHLEQLFPDMPSLEALLLDLEVQGVINRLPGNHYAVRQ